MEREQPTGGERPEVNSYGTDDPEEQAHIENARIDASRQRRRDRARLERYVEAGLDPGDAEAVIEYEHRAPDQRRQADAPEPVTDGGEAERRSSPRIYVASLTDYNNGDLHGTWLDANQSPEQLREQIEAMLAGSGYPGAEEWAIHDYDGLYGFSPHEYEDLSVVSRVAGGIAEHGEAFAAYLSWAGSSEEALADFESHYMGRWDSREAWARDTAADFEWEQQIQRLLDPMLARYVSIDYAALIRDMDSEWHFVDRPSGVYVFAP